MALILATVWFRFVVALLIEIIIFLDVLSLPFLFIYLFGEWVGFDFVDFLVPKPKFNIYLY